MYVHYGHAGAIYLRGVAGTKKVGANTEKNRKKTFSCIAYLTLRKIEFHGHTRARARLNVWVGSGYWERSIDIHVL